MAKVTGLILIFSCGVLLGWLRADGLRCRALRLQELRDFLRQFRTQLEATRATPGEIVARLARQSAFQRNEVIQRLAAGFLQSSSFGENIAPAVADCAWVGKTGVCDILLALGDDIGVKDLESQLGALTAAELLLEREVEEAKERYQKYGGLSQRLGILLGLLVVVVLA